MKDWKKECMNALESCFEGNSESLVARDAILEGTLPVSLRIDVDDSRGAADRILTDDDVVELLHSAMKCAMMSPRGIGVEHSTHPVPHSYRWSTSSDWAYAVVGIDCAFGMIVHLKRWTAFATIRKPGIDVGPRAFGVDSVMRKVRAFMRGV